MYSLMRFQVHFCFKCLITMLTLVRCVFLLLVPLQVALKRRRGSKFPWTLVAGEKPLVFVSVGVFLQVKLSAEALVAHFTFKELFWLLGLCWKRLTVVKMSGFCCGFPLFDT